jgi:hypothetical protein
VYILSTPEHGGVWLTPVRNLLIPEEVRVRGGWYEEDEQIEYPARTFAQELTASGNSEAVALAAHYVGIDKKWPWRAG